MEIWRVDIIRNVEEEKIEERRNLNLRKLKFLKKKVLAISKVATCRCFLE
jgi:hypothetical protein